MHSRYLDGQYEMQLAFKEIVTLITIKHSTTLKKSLQGRYIRHFYSYMRALVFIQQLQLKLQAEKLKATARNATIAEQWNPEFMSLILLKSKYLLEEASAKIRYTNYGSTILICKIWGFQGGEALDGMFMGFVSV